MPKEIILADYEFYTMLAFIVLGLFLGLLAFAYKRMTPAGVFLKAWWKKSPIIWIRYRTGLGEFKVGKTEAAGSMDVKGSGYYLMSEGSQVMEKRSKVPVYDAFSEYGVTIPSNYAPIIQELREKGFKITNFHDYNHLILISKNEEYFKEWKASLKKEAEREEADRLKARLEGMELKLKPFKTYRMHELANMFPNNISPVYVDAKVTDAVNSEVKKRKLNNQLVLYFGLAAFLIIIGIMIFLKVYQTPQPEVIVKVVESGLQTVATSGNVTI